MAKNQTRTLSAYEKNHLQKYGVSQETALKTETPVEYLTGHVSFCDLDFVVTPDVLIPRVETEELVAEIISEAKKIYLRTQRELQIIDVGTGSGAIAVAIAHKLNSINIPFSILAVDISDDALEVAQQNKRRLAKNLNISFKKSDLLSNTKDTQFDLIIANLPYIPSNRIENLDQSVKDFEPHLALDGGKSGFELIETLLEQSKELLLDHGAIFLEMDITHTKDNFNNYNNFFDIDVYSDSMNGIHFAKLKKII
jgi:release factor glutamine methyltransferase